MAQTMSLEEAQTRLAEVVAGLPPGDEIVLTRDDQPAATIQAVPASPAPTPRMLGTLKGTILYIAPDFDAIPEGFEECT